MNATKRVFRDGDGAAFRLRAATLLLAVALAFAALGAVAPECAFAEVDSAESAEVEVSADGESARMDGCAFAVEGFYRAQTGSNREIEGVYYGYAYIVDAPDLLTVATTSECAVVYVPPAYVDQFGMNLADEALQDQLKALIIPLDKGFAKGAATLDSQTNWYFTSQQEFKVGDARFLFGQELKEGRFYTVIVAADGSDAKEALSPGAVDTCRLVPAEEAVVVGKGTALEQLGEFLATMDYSPLWVTLRTCGTAIVIVFFLGLAAAYFMLRIGKRAQDILDTIFTIPMVLPPTVCGFLLLMMLSRNTAFGKFFIDIGFPLAFSWQATVIAAVVVAFPLMYRSARGAFESLDPNMLDAARTLGWSNGRIFVKLMMPLAWSSIASGTVLAFARALGEFGCTLFLAGNQIGSTRTIPIAIYFEWMNGNQGAAWFWTIVLIIFSFLVILFINVWSRHTTKYRLKDGGRTGRAATGKRGGKAGRAKDAAPGPDAVIDEAFAIDDIEEAEGAR